MRPPRLSLPLAKLRERYDVAVVGSGYGGGVAANVGCRGASSQSASPAPP